MGTESNDHVEQRENEIANLQFRVDSKNPEKIKWILTFKEKFLSSAQTTQTVMGALPLELTREQAGTPALRTFSNTVCSVQSRCSLRYSLGQGQSLFPYACDTAASYRGILTLHKDIEIVSRDEHKVTRKAWEVPITWLWLLEIWNKGFRDEVGC